MTVTFKKTGLETTTVIIGLPEHLNQLSNIEVEGQDITAQLDQLKQHRVIQSKLGAVHAAGVTVNDTFYRVITVGLENLNAFTRKKAFKAYGSLFRYLKDEQVTDAQVYVDTLLSKNLDSEALAEIFGIQSTRTTYAFDSYKSDKPAPYQLTLALGEVADSVFEAVEKGAAQGEAINVARDFSNTPPNILTPAYFAEGIEKHFEGTSVDVDVKDRDAIQSEGYGLLFAVGKASVNGPRLITMTYNGTTDESVQPIALVGKGITYDSGGYSLKMGQHMAEMKYDMCGAANVVAMISAAEKLKLPVKLVGVIAAAENMLARDAVKPDDVVTGLSGETVEILNTDAEGRLVLADAVHHANLFNPQVVFDFATLTGAAIAALGEDKAAIFKNNDAAPMAEILKQAETMNEYAFELPITDLEREALHQSEVADLTNHVYGRQGSTLFAAAFVTHFSGDTPHIHFDIAGPATTNKVSYNGPKGATGSMVLTVVNWLKSLNK